MLKYIFYTFLLLSFSLKSFAKVVKYDFDINTKTVNFTGKDVKALAVGGSIPAPLIEAELGDILEVTFNNKLDVETSIHWHGVLLENSQDGVPYLTTMPIKAKSSFTYSFPVKHTGTYWYHSHTGLQEQRGVYGPIAFKPKKQIMQYDHDYTVVLSDWNDENPHRVLANLKKDGDYYAFKKDTVQSWDKVIKYGAVKNRLKQSWNRMGGMDLSDVGYDAFLSNGRKTSRLNAKKGDIVRLRIINASASSYFNLQYSGGNMKVISSDGMLVQPFEANKIRISIAETYDVLIKIPDDKSYELRASSVDGTGYSSTIIGNSEEVIHAPVIPKPILVKMSMNHDMSSDHDMNKMDNMKKHHHMNHNMKDMSHSKSTMKKKSMPMGNSKKEDGSVFLNEKNYYELKSLDKTTLDKNNPTREIILNLTGNMERYTWSFNNKTLKESDKIKIKKGENVKFIFINKTMMNHPLHLHGHFFRVLNGQDDYAPLKHTVNVPPMGKVEIEFYANEEKDWFFHCHNLYHMKSGMTRIISYDESDWTSPVSSELLEERRKVGKEKVTNLIPDPIYYRTIVSSYSNMVDGIIKASNTRNILQTEFDINYDNEYDVDVSYQRVINKYLRLYTGANLSKEDNNDEELGFIGFSYVLPMLIESDIKIFNDGNVELGLSSELQFTKRISFDWEVSFNSNGNEEGKAKLEYDINKKLSLTAVYDSDFGSGIGFSVKF